MAEVRTTVTLPKDLLDELTRVALERRQPLKQVIREMLRLGLIRSRRNPRSLPPPIRLKGGYRPSSSEIERAIRTRG